MHKRIRCVATLCILLILAVLFTVPRAYLGSVCDEISASTNAAREAVMLGDDPGSALAGMKRAYERSAPKLRLFLDHAAVDELGVAVVACEPLTEPEHLLSTLNEVDAAVAHLINIESLSPDSLF